MGALVLGVVVMLLACGGGTPPPAPPPVSNSVAPAPPDAQPPSQSAAMVALHRFTDEMCTCTTAECAKQVSDRMTEWSMQVAEEQKEPFQLTEAEQKQATELGTRMGECMMRAMNMQPSQSQPAQPQPAQPTP